MGFGFWGESFTSGSLGQPAFYTKYTMVFSVSVLGFSGLLA